MNFTKVHGAGNDFIIINTVSETLPDMPVSQLVRKLCAQHTSIGADGLMLVCKPSMGGDYSMLFYNSDGSLGEMCGNGARCICRYGYENGLAGETQRVETTAGIVIGQRITSRSYRIRLNDPSICDLHRQAFADGNCFDCAYIELGDPGIPHAIVRMDDWTDIDRSCLRELGRELRFSPVFPKGANVTFVSSGEEGRVNAITFERGVEDFTLACGTGCGSTALALIQLGLINGSSVKIAMPGGELTVDVTDDGIFLTGPTNIVCTGTITDEDLF